MEYVRQSSGLETVMVLFEDGGRPLPRHRLAMGLREWSGKLVLRSGHDELLRRSVIVAHLVAPDDPERDLVPPLVDARFTFNDEHEARIDGLDLDLTNRKFTAQAWHVKYPEYARRDKRCL